MSWLYGKPVEGDISEFRLVRMSFCYGAEVEYIMHKDHVGHFVKASVKLHHTPGTNPANKKPTARIWRITSAPLHGHSYWWTTPSLEGNDDPDGAVIVKGGPSETVFIDREYVDRINREEDDLEDDDSRSIETAVAPGPSDPIDDGVYTGDPRLAHRVPNLLSKVTPGQSDTRPVDVTVDVRALIEFVQSVFDFYNEGHSMPMWIGRDARALLDTYKIGAK